MGMDQELPPYFGGMNVMMNINPRNLDPYAIALRVARPLERRVAWLEEDQKLFDLEIK